MTKKRPKRRPRPVTVSLAKPFYALVQYLKREQGVVASNLIRMHCRVTEPRSIDISAGVLAMWKASQHVPNVATDIQPRTAGVVQAAWSDLPRLYAAASYDVVVADPIHVADARPTSQRYGRYVAEDAPVTGSEGLSTAHQQILQAARYLLDPTGVLIMKVKNYNHGNAFQHVTYDLHRLADELGWRYCDEDASLMDAITDDPKWKMRLLAPKVVTSWVVLHPTERCYGRGYQRPEARICQICNRGFRARADARLCSPACRQRASRASRQQRVLADRFAEALAASSMRTDLIAAILKRRAVHIEPAG